MTKAEDEEYDKEYAAANRQALVGTIIFCIIVALAILFASTRRDPQPDATPTICEQAQTC